MHLAELTAVASCVQCGVIASGDPGECDRASERHTRSQRHATAVEVTPEDRGGTPPGQSPPSDPPAAPRSGQARRPPAAETPNDQGTRRRDPTGTATGTTSRR